MSLDWQIDRIDNYKELCWIDNGDTDADGEKLYDLNPVTHALIWASIPVGLDSITKENVDEFFVRLSMLEQSGSKFMVKWPQTDEEKHNYGHQPRQRQITYEEVHQHIGLVTNVSRKTQAQFHKDTTAQLRRNAEYAAEHYRKNLEAA